MLKRFKRAGVWALALSMAVTMTPATAFADADAPEGADANGQNPVVQIDGEDPDAGEVISEAENVNGDVDSGESEKIKKKKSKIEDEKERKEEKKEGKEQKKADDENIGKSGLPMWYTLFDLMPEKSLSRDFPMTYGQVRSYGESWKTGTSPELQPVEGADLDEFNPVREYAYFKNLPTLYFAVVNEQKKTSESGDKVVEKKVEKIVETADDSSGGNADATEGIKYEPTANQKGWDEPGYVLERITPDTGEKPIYAIHMTAVDVTVAADDASTILQGDGLQEPNYTVTETIGDYPDDLDFQMKMNKGAFGRDTTVLRGLFTESKETSRLIPLLNSTHYNDSDDPDKLTGVLWYNVVNHVEATSEQDEEIDLVNSGFMSYFNGGSDKRKVKAASDELNEMLTANSEVADAIESGDMDEYLEAIGTMSESEAFDMSKLCDPPIHLVMQHGTLYIYEDASALPADEGFVDKQMEATNLDSSYKTTVTMTLPVTDKEFDPEDYFRFSGSNFYYQVRKAYKMVREKVAANAEETVDAQGMSLRRYYNPLTAPKQHDTILPYSEIVMNLADGFTLPVAEKDGELDLSKLSLIDYQYFFEPEKPAEDDQNLDQLNAEGYGYGYSYFDSYENEGYETYQAYYQAHKEWYDANVFKKELTKDTKTGYYVRDLKGYKLSPEELYAEEEDDSEDEEFEGFTTPVEIYGFGLKVRPEDAYVEPDPDEDDEDKPDEQNLQSAAEEGSVYDSEDFAYLLVYLPEGLGTSKMDKELAEELCTFNKTAITGPCMILYYAGYYGKDHERRMDSSVTWNALNPLHYFEFQFEETLNNVSTASGTHGSYDRYGEAGGSSIKVLKDATLYRKSLAEIEGRERPVPVPVYIDDPDDEFFRLNSLEDDEDEVEPQEKPEEFYIPTVSYTVPGGGSSGGRSSGGLSSTTITEPQVPLAELPELNKKDHVAYVIGYEDGTVRPENLITRAEVSTIFFRLLTDDSRKAVWSTNNSYTDTVAGAWYNNAVSTLSNGGVLSGYTDGTFLPSGNITRAEFATIAARFDESVVDTSSVSFSDISGHWAENNIKRAAALGYITGYQDGSFKPNAPITRAEAMTLMNRVLGRDKISAAGLLDNMAKWSDNPATAWYYVAVQEATNTHDYTITDGVETWTSILANRDWAALEKEWATGAERGAEVFQPVEEEEPAAEETPATESEAGTEAEA